jgi:hypothetical protein
MVEAGDVCSRDIFAFTAAQFGQSMVIKGVTVEVYSGRLALGLDMLGQEPSCDFRDG